VERRIGVLVNPSAGKGKASGSVRTVIGSLQERGDRVLPIQGDSAEHAKQLVRHAVEEGLDILVALGGDGTVHLALQAVAGTQTPLAIVPQGTGNDGAAALGLELHNPRKAAEAILEGEIRTFDVGHVVTAEGNEAYFLCVLSTGFDSLVNDRANRMTRPSGDLRYVVALLAELRSFEPIQYTIDIDGVARERPGMIAAFANATSFGGGMKVAPNADMHDGLLDMIWVDPISRGKLIRLFPSLYPGKHIKRAEVHESRVRSARVAAEGAIAFADGEWIGTLPLTVTCVPDGVRIVLPKR
jgi:diacylglycerol kinase (ATP)